VIDIRVAIVPLDQDQLMGNEANPKSFIGEYSPS